MPLSFPREVLDDYTTLFGHVYERQGGAQGAEIGAAVLKFRTFEDLAAYWRTPAILRAPEGRAALGIGDDERCIGLLHFGSPRQEQRVPDRAPVDAVVSFLD